MFPSRVRENPGKRLSVENRSFSNGDTVDFVETAKCRILLHELEKGWWVLAVGSKFFFLIRITDRDHSLST